jgi:uncharacterized membrane protein YeiB
METTYSESLTDAPAPVTGEAAPIPPSQRIAALDVVRGFALIGIFLMNIEWFNRPFATINDGIPRDLGTLDWLATYFVNYFVQGKFWTIFSLLFGMGFAIMLVRAERAGRDFVAIYLRRILALAVIGAVHYIYLWPGDILFSYAVAAGALLIVLYGRAKYILLAIAALVGLGFIPHCNQFFGVAGALATIALVTLYLRNERLIRVLGFELPIASLILLTLGALASIGAVVLWLLPNGPEDPRLPLTVLGPVAVIWSLLSVKYHNPKAKRSVRTGVALFLLMPTNITLFGLAQYLTPPDPVVPAITATAPTAPSAAPAAVAPAARPVARTADHKAADKTPPKTKEQRAAERKAKRDKDVAEEARDAREEVRLLTTGSYWDVTLWHASTFVDKAAGDPGFAVILIGMFLLGMWFVRSGIMENTAAHLGLFRKFALIGLPVGLGLSVLASMIAVSHVPGATHDAWVLAFGIKTLGDLPTCLGYVAVIVLMLNSRGPLSNIKILAPLGRMALTNYLTQSLICAVYFYNYGLGHWGIPRAQQVLFVLIVYSLQIAFSHWWLARFRYGPMEWLWRGFTYRQMPPMRIRSVSPALRTS